MAGGKALGNFLRMRPGMGIHAWLCIRSGGAVRVRRAMAMTVSRPVFVPVIVTMTVLIPMLMRMIVACFMAVHMVAVDTNSTLVVSMPVVMAVVMGLRQTL